ncbi:nitrile hydratase accessory protein [soil metagenome]
MTAIDPDAARRAVEANPGLPADAQGPVFREPWQAQAFTMTLALHEKGLFAWSEWAAMLGETIKAAQVAGDPDTGETYYRHWLATLERMTAEKAVTTSADLTTYRDAWERAAARTPHGQPIELKTGDFGG